MKFLSVVAMSLLTFAQTQLGEAASPQTEHQRRERELRRLQKSTEVDEVVIDEVEKRPDPYLKPNSKNSSKRYSKAQFLQFYGTEPGLAIWEKAGALEQEIETTETTTTTVTSGGDASGGLDEMKEYISKKSTTPKDRMHAIKEKFKAIDTDGDLLVEASEWVNLMMGEGATEEDAMALFKLIDQTNSGSIGLSEFDLYLIIVAMEAVDEETISAEKQKALEKQKSALAANADAVDVTSDEISDHEEMYNSKTNYYWKQWDSYIIGEGGLAAWLKSYIKNEKWRELLHASDDKFWMRKYNSDYMCRTTLNLDEFVRMVQQIDLLRTMDPEIVGRLATTFTAMDTDSDGYVSSLEYTPEAFTQIPTPGSLTVLATTTTMVDF